MRRLRRALPDHHPGRIDQLYVHGQHGALYGLRGIIIYHLQLDYADAARRDWTEYLGPHFDPVPSDSLTAGEWNHAASANNRIEIRLR